MESKGVAMLSAEGRKAAVLSVGGRGLQTCLPETHPSLPARISYRDQRQVFTKRNFSFIQ